MSETQQADTAYRQREQFEDEIELMDYLRVIWKWKYLIVAGTLICAVAAGVISFSMSKVYRIDMVLRPGVLSIQPDGKNVYSDSVDNIKAMIEAGTFDRETLSNIGESKNNGFPKSLNLKVNIPKGSNTLKVSYETSDADRGLRTLDRLGQVLLKNSGRVQYFHDEYETQIALKKTEMADREDRRRAAEWNIKNTQKRIDELRSEIEFIKKNTHSLLQERDKFISNKSTESNILSGLIYTNTVQQSIALENSYRRKVNEYMTKREDEKLNLQKLNGESKRLLEEIKGLEFKKNSFQGIEILKPATKSPHPIKPKIKLNVMLATILGLFVMLFLAFFLEYIQRHRDKLGQ